MLKPLLVLTVALHSLPFAGHWSWEGNNNALVLLVWWCDGALVRWWRKQELRFISALNCTCTHILTCLLLCIYIYFLFHLLLDFALSLAAGSKYLAHKSQTALPSTIYGSACVRLRAFLCYCCCCARQTRIRDKYLKVKANLQRSPHAWTSSCVYINKYLLYLFSLS